MHFILQLMAYFHWFIILFFQRMSSQQSSFRDVFDYPREGTDPKHRKYGARAKNKKADMDSTRPLKQSFYDIVQKAKHVALFTQTLKQKIVEKGSLSQHTLKTQQLEFLQNDSQLQTANVYFEHHSKIILTFEIAFIASLLAYLWNCTFQIVFGTLVETPTIKIMAFCMYLAHIALFNITEHKNQKFELISNRNEINRIYNNQKLVKDCVFLLMIVIELTPLDNFESLQWLYIIIRLISLISYAELSQTWDKIEDLLSVSNQAETSISMLKLIYKIALFLHFVSIALNILAIIQTSSNIESTWIANNGIEFDTNLDKYIVGWYWGATILSTVGFGEITPKSNRYNIADNYERFFISIVQVICCMTFGYFVNVIGALIKLRGQPEEKYEKQIRSLNRCLNFLSTTNDLKHKIRTYLFNRHIIEQLHDPNEEKEVLENLTPTLHHALLEENNINILKKSPAMEKLKHQTLVKLTNVLKKTILAPEHIIYSRITGEKKLWFIESGAIQEFTDTFNFSKLKKLVSFYNENDSIVGWINFLTQANYRTMAKAKIFTIAYELQQQGFLNILKEDIRQYHRYLHMRQLMIEKNRKYVHKCISCDRYTHNVINCPRIHFVRKDVKKLCQQHLLLHKFVDDQGKKKKMERSLIRYDWKARYSTGQLDKQTNLAVSNVGDNSCVQNLFKNMLFRQSVIGFERRKMSFMMTKKQSRYDTILFDPKESREHIVERSFLSSDEVIEQEIEQFYDRVFFTEQEVKDYMPNHDVGRVLTTYSNKYSKKVKMQDRLRRFVKK